MWSLDSWDCECTFSGHRTAVTALRFSQSGSVLASGGQDCAVVVWDVSGEAGLFRLAAHRGQITDIAFLTDGNRLVSSSKDETVRVWDLDTQHCCQTLASCGGEVWALDCDASGRRLAVGSTDAEVRLYSINAETPTEVLRPMGSVRRSTMERVAALRYFNTPDGSSVLSCQGAGKVTEVWRVRDAAEAQKRRKRRLRRRREKGKDSANLGSKQKQSEDGVEQETVTDVSLEAVDELEPLVEIRCKHKVSSCVIPPFGQKRSRRAPLRVILSLANNSLEVWEVSKASREEDDEEDKADEGQGSNRAEATRVAVIDGPGHRSDVRAIALSSDDTLCLSTSNSGIKIWNPRSGTCLRSIDAGYGLAACFVPGNKFAIVGTKEGALEVLDVSAAELTTSTGDAHGGPVWSLAMLPDGSGIVSGGADKNVKFWEWNIIHQGSSEDSGPGTLGLAPTRTLTMTDDVLCVRISPNGKLIAVALLDSTVRVFFVDSLKFFLSMYGHKLPVLSMDISSDNTLLATGSADKNLKIWGMDFGDCHRSLFAHGDSVMGVAFVPRTHYVFTAGKDGMVKYWDADKFELLLELPGHHGEVWALTVSSLGDFLVTGSHDRSLRRWERTDEPFFVEEEKEKRLESLFEEDLVRQEPGDVDVEAGKEENGVSTRAGRKTLETLSAADAIVDALDLAGAEEERIQEGGEVQVPNPLLLGMSPSEYVLGALAKVRGSDLEQALLLVPFTDALRLLRYMCEWLRKGAKIELLGRAAVLLMRVHMQQLAATPGARPLLLELRRMLQGRVQSLKDVMGLNVAAIEHLQRALADRGSTGMTAEAAAAALAPLKKQKLGV